MPRKIPQINCFITRGRIYIFVFSFLFAAPLTVSACSSTISENKKLEFIDLSQANNCVLPVNITMHGLPTQTNPFFVQLNNNDNFFQKNLVALLALGASILSLWLSYNLPRKARIRSIHDEFWLRTISFPLVIQPIIDFFGEIIASLPSERNSEVTNTVAFLTMFQKKFDSLQYKLRLLPPAVEVAIKSTKLHSIHAEMSEALNMFEDSITEYCYFFNQEKNSNEEISAKHQHVLALSAVYFAKFLLPIKNLQTKT